MLENTQFRISTLNFNSLLHGFQFKTHLCLEAGLSYGYGLSLSRGFKCSKWGWLLHDKVVWSMKNTGIYYPFTTYISHKWHRKWFPLGNLAKVNWFSPDDAVTTMSNWCARAYWTVSELHREYRNLNRVESQRLGTEICILLDALKNSSGRLISLRNCKSFSLHSTSKRWSKQACMIELAASKFLQQRIQYKESAPIWHTLEAWI